MPNQDHEDLKQPVNKRTAADRKRSREASITFTHSLGDGKVCRTLLTDTIKIGKLMSTAHDLHIDHPSVSRMHAYVQRHGDEFFISDLGSAHGTYLDGQRVNKAKLVTGTVLRIGEVDLEVQIGDEVAAPAAVPAAPEPPVEKSAQNKAQDLLGRLHEFVQDFAVPPATKTSPVDEKVYYCDTCFRHYWQVVEMQRKDQQYCCPTCGGQWKLNRGHARHVVALSLHRYRKLARTLGMPDEQT